MGADAAPSPGPDTIASATLEVEDQENLSGYRWMTIVLFGEGLAGQFERGVGQYPTVGDEVHIVTNADLKVIYGWSKGMAGAISVGTVAATSGIPANINIGSLVSRPQRRCRLDRCGASPI